MKMRIFYNPENKEVIARGAAYSFDISEEEERKALGVPEGAAALLLEGDELDMVIKGKSVVDITTKSGKYKLIDNPDWKERKNKIKRSRKLDLKRKIKQLDQDIELLNELGEDPGPELAEKENAQAELDQWINGEKQVEL